MYIIKRDGRKVEFDSNKIFNAINKAAAETEKGIDYELARDIADSIEDEIKELDFIPTVEYIQDLVEDYLMQSDRRDIAKCYILYRNERSKLRELKKKQNENRLLTDEFLSKYKHLPNPMTQLGTFVFYRTYSRWSPEEKRREYWWETVRRAVEYNCNIIPTSREEAEKLYDNMFHLRQFLSGRTLFTGGTEVSKKYGMSNFNCSFMIIDNFNAFKDLLYLLLVGAGVGVRVKKKDVAKLPPVRGDLKLIHKAYFPVPKKDRKEYTAIDFEDDMVEIIVGDSKEGWCQALEYFMKLFYLNEFSKVKTIIMNYDNVRPAGERLKTFGGYSSGYEPFMKMIDSIYRIFTENNNDKKYLRPIDCMDIANMIGIAVVSGGVRRTSEVVLFEPEDEEIMTSKSNLYVKNEKGEWVINEKIAHRRMSNNSIQYETKPTREQWHKHMLEMRYSGEPAFQNLEAACKRRPDAEGGNPCMEIILRNKGMCNLTEVNVMGFVKNGELDYEALYEAQRLSARAGYRMACIDFELHDWDLVNKEDMLIGCSLTGWQDMINATNMSVDEQIKLMEKLKEIAINAANELADQLGRNRPKLYTTIKPSGTISQLAGVSSGLHFSHSPYYIRRVRINANDPLAKVVQELGYPVFPEVGQTWKNCDTLVIEFPVKAPEGKTKYDVSAIEQLEIYKRFMKHYVTHNASITVHVKPDEWDEVEEWCYENWDDLIAVSFLPLEESFYQLMPYEAISREEYERRIADMKPFNPSLLQKYEKEETDLDITDSDCENGVCPIR